MRAIQAIIRGRVQGVFFRAYTKEEAIRLGLIGWVRNKRDGSVECFAQGSEAGIEALIKFLYTGSPAARVSTVEVRDEVLRSDLEGFQIRY